MSIQNKMMSGKNISKLKADANRLRPMVRIGKNGVTRELIAEVSRLLRKKELVKIKILNNSSQKEMAEEVALLLASKTNSIVIDVIGHTIVLYKKQNYKK